MIHEKLLALKERVSQRPPDFIIDQNGRPYLHRWWVIPRNRWFNVYLHKFLQSDQDFALHCHPWIFNLSYVLEEKYIEHTFNWRVWFTKWHSRFTTRRLLSAGEWKLRLGRAPHKVELFIHDFKEGRLQPRPVWTLFITGPVVREWGFWCPRGWVPFRKIVDYTKGGSRPREGCPE